MRCVPALTSALAPICLRAWLAVAALGFFVASGSAEAQRPSYTLSLSSNKGFPFLVLGTTGTQTVATRVRDAMDNAWEAEIVQAGWPAPPPDQGGPDSKFDVYVDTSLGEDESYVEQESRVGTVSWYAMTSFMGVPDTFANDQQLYSIVAHELNHVSHFALDAAEDDAFFEHTAVMVEQKVARYAPEYGVGIEDFQTHPERALNYLRSDLYEYGAGMWLMFLSEHYDAGGHALVRRLWEESKQSTSDNHPHYFDGLKKILSERGDDLAGFFATFATWRYFTGPRDDGLHFEDGDLWGATSLVPVTRVSLVSPATVQASIGAYGMTLREMDVPGGTGAFDVRLNQTETAAAIVPLDPTGKALADPAIVRTAGQTVRVAALAGVSRVLFALTSVPAAYDPNVTSWPLRSVSAQVTAVSGTPTDGGTLPDGGGSDSGFADSGFADSGFSDSGAIDSGAGDAQGPSQQADAGTDGGSGADEPPGCGCAASGAFPWTFALALAVGFLCAPLPRPRRRTKQVAGS